MSIDMLPGGRARGLPDEDFDARELACGILVELEHTPNFAIAKEIAKDHLVEDADYYRKLARIHPEGCYAMERRGLPQPIRK